MSVLAADERGSTKPHLRSDIVINVIASYKPSTCTAVWQRDGAFQNCLISKASVLQGMQLLITALLAHRFLPKNLKLIGYARSKLTDSDLHNKVKDYLKGDDRTKDEFLSRISYVPGAYDGDEGFQVGTHC